MSKPILYGIANSRAFRSLWAAEEIGLDYEHVQTSFRGDAQEASYLAVNPNGRIPALVDGEMKLFESMAINTYLARVYGDGLLPTDASLEAQTWQWSIWGISEIEPLQMQIVVQKFFVPEDRRDESVVNQALRGLRRPLDVLEAHLKERDYLLGDRFTLADLNLAGVMDLLSLAEVSVDEWQAVRGWLDSCYARQSFAAAKSLS
ncbi:MAG: glutathione S-transferase family protein [Pseudomonadota bacterium]